MRAARRLTLVWVGLTLVALGWPTEALPEPPTPGLDKIAHAVIFAVGAVVALSGWPHRVGMVLLALIVFAPLTELWQAVLPTGRTAEVSDVVANLVGIGVGAIGWAMYRKRRP